MDGTIVVDGILASCYAFSDHHIAHIGTTAIHWFPELIEIIFGKDYESTAFVQVVEEFGKMVFPFYLTSPIN